MRSAQYLLNHVAEQNHFLPNGFAVASEDFLHRVRLFEVERAGGGAAQIVQARARSEVISRLFHYFAQVKAEQIVRIRNVCETF